MRIAMEVNHSRACAFTTELPEYLRAFNISWGSFHTCLQSAQIEGRITVAKVDGLVWSRWTTPRSPSFRKVLNICCSGPAPKPMNNSTGGFLHWDVLTDLTHQRVTITNVSKRKACSPNQDIPVILKRACIQRPRGPYTSGTPLAIARIVELLATAHNGRPVCSRSLLTKWSIGNWSLHKIIWSPLKNYKHLYLLICFAVYDCWNHQK